MTRTGIFGFPGWVLAVTAVLSIAFAAHAVSKPKFAYDSITYLGCLFRAVEGGSWAKTHARTFTYVAERFPDDIATELTTAPPGISPYREIIATDPEAFRQRLKTACYKIGFVGPAIALAALGVDPFLSLQILSAPLAALLLAVAMLWTSRKINPVFALPITVVAAFSGLFQTARYEYPDSMTALFVASALLAFADKRTRLACVLFLAAILIRVDAILYFGVFLAFAVFLATDDRRMTFRTAMAWGIAALALYSGITIAMETPSYDKVFYHSFIAQQPYMLDAQVTVTFEMYVDVIVRQIGVVASKSLKYPALAAMAIVAGITGFLNPAIRPYGDIALISLMMVVLHFLFIPWFDTRYYAGPYMIIVLGFAVASVRLIELKFRKG